VNNVGLGILIIANLAITGADAADFAQTNNCGSSLAAERSCTIAVTFTPVARGGRTAAVSITDNAIGARRRSASSERAPRLPRVLPGRAIRRPGSASPTSLSFATQPIATTSAVQAISLTNGTGATLSIAGLAIAGADPADFVEIANTCGASVVRAAPAQSG
jgi:hypothetical protein